MSVGACQEADNFASAFTFCRASRQSVVRAWDCLRSLLNVYTGLGMHRALLIHTALQIPRTGSEFPKAPVAISLLSFSFKAFQLSSASGSHKVKQLLWIFQQTSHSRGKDSLQRQWTSSKLKLNKDSLEMSLPLYRNHYNITLKLLWRNRYTGQITTVLWERGFKEVQPHLPSPVASKMLLFLATVGPLISGYHGDERWTMLKCHKACCSYWESAVFFNKCSLEGCKTLINF